MADIEALCKRVVVIHQGHILFDGPLGSLVERFSAYKKVSLTLDRPNADLAAYGEVIARDGSQVTLRIPRLETPQITARLLAEQVVHDLTVEDPPVEDVIEQVFSQAEPGISGGVS
jgi:ABC-2 type transport system ATP-binding protein